MALVATPPSSPPIFSSRPQPARRPSALRKASSDHIITPAVTRFDPQTSHIPSSSTPLTDPSRFRPRTVSPSAPSQPTSLPTTTSLSSPPPPEKTPSPPLARSPVQPLASPTSQSSPSSQSSLLARRRSSRTAVRPDILPLLDSLKLPDLPIPPLDHLDDTVVGEVIGVSTQSQTPSLDVLTPGGRDAVVVEKPYKPTRSFVPTPFPEKGKKIFFDSKDEGGDSDDEQDDETDTGSKNSSSPVAVVTEGIKWLPLQEAGKPSES
ncbi:hypothetical protein JCM5296_004901 [Sporobolomyces johnsonii]